jgi:hypothetical protein
MLIRTRISHEPHRSRHETAGPWKSTGVAVADAILQIRLEILGGRGMGANLLACLCLDLQCLILVPLRHQAQNEDRLLGVSVFLLSWKQSPFSPKPSPKPLFLRRVFRPNLPSKSQNSALSSTPHLPSISRWWRLSSPSSCSVAQSVSPQASDLVIERHLGPCVTAALKGIFSRLAAFGGGDGEVWGRGIEGRC